MGRTALSSYLGQSVAFNLLFPWYGLALWGKLDHVKHVINDDGGSATVRRPWSS